MGALFTDHCAQARFSIDDILDHVKSFFQKMAEHPLAPLALFRAYRFAHRHSRLRAMIDRTGRGLLRDARRRQHLEIAQRCPAGPARQRIRVAPVKNQRGAGAAITAGSDLGRMRNGDNSCQPAIGRF